MFIGKWFGGVITYLIDKIHNRIRSGCKIILCFHNQDFIITDHTEFSLLQSIQTSPGAHSAFCSVGAGAVSLSVKLSC